MLNDPLSRYVLAKGQQREALREAALLRQAKAAKRSQVGLSTLLLLSASLALLALSQRLKKLAADQAMRS